MTKRGRPRKTSGAIYRRPNSAYWWVRYRDRQGRIVKETAGTTDREEAERFLRDRLNARDDGLLPTILAAKHLTFDQWADWFLEMRSKPPFRSANTHRANLETLIHLRPVFGSMWLSDITPDAIEEYNERRLRSKRRIRTKLGVQYRGRIKPATVHKEFRVLRRILNVAVQKKKLNANPCATVEFTVRLSASTRKPHYMTGSEQQNIEFFAPDYLRDAIVILVETGLRPYKELTPMHKAQVDLGNGVVHVQDSKTENGIADIPLTQPARQAFRRRIEATPGSEYVFPTPSRRAKKPHITRFCKAWASTLKRAGVPHFPIYHLRHTFATRLSAGGVADHFVTQMLRQGDSAVFKRYSHAKLNMMREALSQLDRHANEHEVIFGTANPN